MKRLLCVFVLLFSIYGSSFTQDKRPVYVLELNGVINPVSAKFIHEALDQAQEDGAECFIIQMDTPGGLMESMRTIIKDILASRIPVIVYVNPSGSRAASAGVFICYSAHIVAMTPGTNIGAAHPVTIGQTDSTSAIMEKVTNDAAAYIRSLAEKRNRNVEWGEKAVRESVSITEKEALELNVIDYIVPTLDSLLSVIDGKEVDMDDQKYILHTENAEIITIRMNWRFRILDKISDPNIAYILMLLGMYGIIFELSNPGSVLPGIVGVIFLILAFFAMQTLPLNYAGLMLIIFAIILFLLEIKVVSYGLLSIGGVISMLLGSLMLFDSPEPFFKVSLSVILPAVILTAAFFLFAIGFGLKAQKQKPVSGAEGIIGEVGVAIEKINPEGRIKVHGEFWNAVAESPIKPKEKVKVCAVLDGLMLKVEPLKKSD
ncbi:nodulation protein NfeD [candidate division KSB1 bacterium]|nr:nodulation protein NfeD [candidate division KSB1 bacterium]